jgi:hypothetical protein
VFALVFAFALEVEFVFEIAIAIALALAFVLALAFALDSRRSLTLGTGLVVSLSNPCRFAPFALALALVFALDSRRSLSLGTGCRFAPFALDFALAFAPAYTTENPYAYRSSSTMIIEVYPVMRAHPSTEGKIAGYSPHIVVCSILPLNKLPIIIS